MNIITCIPNLLILFGSFLMAVFPFVMSGYGKMHYIEFLEFVLVVGIIHSVIKNCE